jgi:hypothetical protein
MKTGIVGIINNPATSMNSHSAGMVNIVKQLFDATILNESDDWDVYDRLIIYHGVNFRKDSFNIIGGINDSVIKRCEKLSNYKGDMKTLDEFQLNSFSQKRKLLSWDNFKDIETISLPEKRKIVIGDSHSISVWPNIEYAISRNDGKTLYGFLKQDRDLSQFDHVIMYFGNIDLRFHLCRQDNPKSATIELFNRYCDYASKYNSTITMLLPVEEEDRKIPKSGQYKGNNFFGSLELRKELRMEANLIIAKSGIDYIDWPSTLLNENGNLSFDVMEPRQSVHLRPSYYMNELKKQLTLF